MIRKAPTARLAQLWQAVRASLAAFLADDVLTLAASLSFYTLLSFAPIVTLAIWLASFAGGHAQESLFAQIAAIAGQPARDAAEAVVASGKAHPNFGGLAGVLGILTLLVGATTVFAQLQSSLNVIFEVIAKPTNAIWAWLCRRILSAGVLLACGFVVMVSLLVNALLDWGFERTGLAWNAVNELVTVIIFAGLFAALFRYLPDARIGWRYALIGGAITAILFGIGKWLIGVYVLRGDVGGAYGAAGSFVVVLVWTYYSAAIFFFGAELTKASLDALGIPIEPTAHAERIPASRSGAARQPGTN
jgi:membrane protein